MGKLQEDTSIWDPFVQIYLESNKAIYLLGGRQGCWAVGEKIILINLFMYNI